MNEGAKGGETVSHEELEQFVQALSHEVRNRLSGIALEAADLAEQAGDQMDARRLQQQVQECSTLLKRVRELISAEAQENMSLPELTPRLKERSL